MASEKPNIEGLSREDRYQIAINRVKMNPQGCGHWWEFWSPWDNCTGFGAALAVPKQRACGHHVCDHHILMHGMMQCPAAGMQVFGFTSNAAIETDKETQKNK